MMTSANVKSTPKVKANVELVTHDGVVLKGKIFTVPSQRVLDMLNDDRAFLPFETDDGELVIVNKRFIARLRPIGTDKKAGRDTAQWIDS